MISFYVGILNCVLTFARVLVDIDSALALAATSSTFTFLAEYIYVTKSSSYRNLFFSASACLHKFLLDISPVRCAARNLSLSETRSTAVRDSVNVSPADNVVHVQLREPWSKG